MNPWYRKKAEQQVDIQNQRASSQQGERKKERKITGQEEWGKICAHTK